MGASSGFPIDLILFGMIAAFLVLRLRSILGKRTGFERPAQPYQPPANPAAAGPVIDGQAEAQPAANRRPTRAAQSAGPWSRCGPSTAASNPPPSWTGPRRHSA